MQTYKLRNRTGFCIYSVGDGNYSKFVNSLRSSPIKFYGLAYREDKLYGYVNSCDYKHLDSLAREHGLEAEIIEQSGLMYSSQGYHRRFGLLVGFILSLIMIAFLNDRVMIIEVGGNENITDERIISLLRDTGIYTGCSISDVDLRRAERQIKSMEKDIDWIGIRNTGSRVVVEVNEIINVPEIETKNTPSNIVAARDAQIKQVRVYNGMLIPMVGEAVKKGEVIVSGVIDTKFDRSYYVHSIADITGVYTEKMTFSQPFVSEESTVSHSVAKKAVSLFGKRFVYFADGLVEGEYEYSENETPLTLGNIIFPVSLVEMNYDILKKEEKIRSEAELQTIIDEKIARYEKNIIGENAVITDKEIKRTVTDSGLSVTVTYTVEGEIGMQRQIFAKYEWYDRHETDDRDK